MGTDKALLEMEDGGPLLLRVALRLAEVADPVMLASGSAGRLEAFGYPEVGDEVPGAGPLAGIAAGLAASPHELTAVVAVDRGRQGGERVPGGGRRATTGDTWPRCVRSR